MNDSQIKISSNDLGLGSAPTAFSDASLEALLNTVYVWAGIICVIVIIVGGIRYTTSNGDAAGVKTAKNTILYAIVGLVVIIMAAAITQFVIGRTTGGGSAAPAAEAAPQTQSTTTPGTTTTPPATQ